MRMPHKGVWMLLVMLTLLAFAGEGIGWLRPGPPLLIGVALVKTLLVGGWWMDLRRAHRLWWALFGGMAGALLLGLLGWVMAGE